MSVENNKTIAQRLIRVWGDGDLDLVSELASPSLVVRYPILPKVIESSGAFRQVLASFRSAFAGASLRVEETIAEDEKVVVRWTFSGTHKGNLLGIPPTGKFVTWTGITIYRIVDGKVVEEQGEEDFAGFFRQIGLLHS